MYICAECAVRSVHMLQYVMCICCSIQYVQYVMYMCHVYAESSPKTLLHKTHISLASTSTTWLADQMSSP